MIFKKEVKWNERLTENQKHRRGSEKTFSDERRMYDL